ncbi:hypothetical protein CAC42_1163 [Sphaceloma murrayae]|uniref:Programmed cell death protein 2 C-terminal domain-containing protein n=1 Tax=Sphaceloma murrayae TaxID=2082308 RepID=A0A2K1R271_9PEZI|nr:hypothetical protein CAC42_1163 [Sphaceloma murrayae]
MAPYDSDSSDGEDDFTETGVLLGYASQEATDDAISHLGGHPMWLDEKTLPSGEYAKCKVCNSLLSLLLELNGDLPERFAGHERRLYLLGCRKKACRRKEGSVRGFRATRASRLPSRAPLPEASPLPQQEPTKPKQDLGSSIFGARPSPSSASSNPFSTTSTASSNSNPFASASSLAAKPPQRPDPTPDPAATLPQTFAEKARISASSEITPPQPHGPPPPWPDLSVFPPPFPYYSLDADYETLEAPSTTVPSQTKIDMDIDEPTASSASSSSKDKDANQEVFESSMDKTFQKFADRVAQNPEQILRYEFGGQPLLYSRDDAVGKILAPQIGEVTAKAGGSARSSRVPRCTNCGAERVFELQLMPNAITELETEEMGVDGMDWGTIIFEVCSKDCVPRGVKEGEVGYTEEWVGVQWEELMKRK